MSTATVELLQAEVRVLVVGSRQVTLSVFRQLDEVPIQNLEIFGRVNDRRLGSDHNTIFVVGADDSGSLSRAHISRPSFEIGAGIGKDNRLIIGFETDRALRRTHRRSGFSFTAYIGDERPYPEHGKEFTQDQIHMVTQELNEQADEIVGWYAQWERAKDAPLIVLAGIK